MNKLPLYRKVDYIINLKKDIILLAKYVYRILRE